VSDLIKWGVRHLNTCGGVYACNVKIFHEKSSLNFFVWQNCLKNLLAMNSIQIGLWDQLRGDDVGIDWRSFFEKPEILS
jgi:hypothetical protein